MGACSSKKKTGDSETAAAADTQAPQIDSTPMDFTDKGGSDSGKINGLQSINFEYDRASLSADAKQKIQGNAEWLKSKSGVSMQIEGHCDTRGSIEYNLSLGERRAQAVKNYMTSLGVSAQRLTIISYGKEKPLSMGDSESDHMKNRRANFVPLAQ
jgi:peptidoglycan-associated lipoprotein